MWLKFQDIVEFIQSENGQNLAHIDTAENLVNHRVQAITEAQIKIRNDELFEYVKNQAYLVELKPLPKVILDHESSPISEFEPEELTPNVNYEMVFNIN